MKKTITLCFVLWISPSAQAQEILVFADRHQSVVGMPAFARLIELDQVQHIEATLSLDLSSDPAQSEHLTRSRLNDSTHRQLAEAYQGIVDAWSLGIQKLPAVVVGRRYVIYGEPNVQQAVQRIQAYREGGQ